MEARELQETITFDSELGLGHDVSYWKALDKQKTTTPSRKSIEMIEKKWNFNTPSLKSILKGLVVLQKH
jgi:hypothetical protein